MCQQTQQCASKGREKEVNTHVNDAGLKLEKSQLCIVSLGRKDTHLLSKTSRMHTMHFCEKQYKTETWRELHTGHLYYSHNGCSIETDELTNFRGSLSLQLEIKAAW